MMNKMSRKWFWQACPKILDRSNKLRYNFFFVKQFVCHFIICLSSTYANANVNETNVFVYWVFLSLMHCKIHCSCLLRYSISGLEWNETHECLTNQINQEMNKDISLLRGTFIFSCFHSCLFYFPFHYSEFHYQKSSVKNFHLCFFFISHW